VQAPAQRFDNRLWIFLPRLADAWSAERHWWRRTTHTAWKLRLIGTAAMFDAVRKTGVYRDTAEMEIGFTGVTQGPAANALVQIEQ
jgi:hypothetical protein